MERPEQCMKYVQSQRERHHRSGVVIVNPFMHIVEKWSKITILRSEHGKIFKVCDHFSTLCMRSLTKNIFHIIPLFPLLFFKWLLGYKYKGCWHSRIDYQCYANGKDEVGVKLSLGIV